MWKTHNNKPHSVTPEIRGIKGLFAYYRKFKSIVIDENTSLITMLITVKKKCQTNKIFANKHSKANTEHLASTKTHFNEMIMTDTKGPINPPSDGH